MTTVDDDVQIWVSARLLSKDQPEFGLKELAAAAAKRFRGDGRKLEAFLTHQCLANVAGGRDPHFNYIFRIATGKYRVFKTGDPIEYSHASAPTSPPVKRVPEEFRSLFSATSRFPPELLPAVEAPRPAPRAGKASPPRSKPAVPTPPLTGAALKPASGATSGLRTVLSELDAAVPSNQARSTIFDLLFLELGALGSRLEHQKGASFTLHTDHGAGSAHTLQNVPVRLPSGGTLAHVADVAIELESPPKTLFIDIVESSSRTEELRSRAYDCLHMKKDGRSLYKVLVWLQVSQGGILRDQAEAIAYPYDYFFGVDANDAKNPAKFYALKSQVAGWISGKVGGRAHSG